MFTIRPDPPSPLPPLYHTHRPCGHIISSDLYYHQLKHSPSPVPPVPLPLLLSSVLARRLDGSQNGLEPLLALLTGPVEFLRVWSSVVRMEVVCGVCSDPERCRCMKSSSIIDNLWLGNLLLADHDRMLDLSRSEVDTWFALVRSGYLIRND